MGMQNPYDVGSEIAVIQSPAPQAVVVANSGVAVNGAAVDRQGQGGGLAQSAKVGVHVGALSAGTPVITSVASKIQHSDDGSTGWADFKPDGTNVAQSTAGVAALSTDCNYSVNLRMAKRYIRQVITPTFTGGASGVYLAGTVALGGYPNVPIVLPAP